MIIILDGLRFIVVVGQLDYFDCKFFLSLLRLYSVSRKNRNQNVFCNIFYEIRAILMKFGTPFPE